MRKSRRVRLNNGSTVHVSSVKERQVNNMLRGGSFSKGVDKTVHPVQSKSGKAKVSSMSNKKSMKKK